MFEKDQSCEQFNGPTKSTLIRALATPLLQAKRDLIECLDRHGKTAHEIRLMILALEREAHNEKPCCSFCSHTAPDVVLSPGKTINGKQTMICTVCAADVHNLT